jgi:Amt family ammonium transporter
MTTLCAKAVHWGDLLDAGRSQLGAWIARTNCFGAFSAFRSAKSMENLQSAVDTLVHSSNTLFILIGAVMVLAMHAGFAFLEVGTVRQKNQVNALSKILSDFAVSTLAYFFIGYWISYGVTFMQPAAVISADHGYGLVKFFFLLTFAAAIPAIISGGIAERARFVPQLCASADRGVHLPFFEGMVWNGNYGLQAWLTARFGAAFHDFAGSVVVHAMGGWLALAVLLLGPRNGRYREGRLVAFAPSSIPFLALGSWILIVGWFGFNVMSADLAGRQRSGGGQLVDGHGRRHRGGTDRGRNDPGFLHNGPLAGLVALRRFRPDASGRRAGDRRWPVPCSSGVLPPRKSNGASTTCSAYGRCTVCAACGAGSPAASSARLRWGLGGVSLISQLIGSALGVLVALIGGFAVYGVIKALHGLRLSQEQEYYGADLSLHKIGAVSQD